MLALWDAFGAAGAGDGREALTATAGFRCWRAGDADQIDDLTKNSPWVV